MSHPTRPVCVLGGRGFVGSHLVRRLRAAGMEPLVPEKGECLVGRKLGLVYHCAGLTADFRSRPFDTVDAHVGLVQSLLRSADFEGLVYLSSTRVYLGAEDTAEMSSLSVNPTRPDDLYNLSKLMGESLCLSAGRSGVRVVRLSNVLGQGMPEVNFVASVIRAALEGGVVHLRSALGSAKDYLGIDDVVDMILAIGERGTGALYNVASGVNTTHRELLDLVVRETGCTVDVAPDAVDQVFPPVRIDRIRDEFGFTPRPLHAVLPPLLRHFRERGGAVQ